MSKLILIIGLLGLVGCSRAESSQASKDKNVFGVTCVNVGTSRHIYRCENGEVVCYYVTRDSGLQCKFKDGK